MILRLFRHTLVTGLIVTAASMWALRYILFSPGIPAYLHDWRWPFTMTQLEGALVANTSPWDLSGTGQPNPFPILHPVFAFWWFLGHVCGPAGTLKISLVLILAAYGWGTYACARSWFDAACWPSRFAGVAAILGPTTYTELLAGHLYYLMALAALCWSIALLGQAEPNRRHYLLASAVIGALTALQPQVWVVTFLAFLLLGARKAHILRPSWIAAGGLGCCLFVIPELLGLHYVGVDWLPFLRPTIHWEINNSAPLGSAPVGMGYFAAYADRTYAALPFGALARALLWIMPCLALSALVFVRRTRFVLAMSVWLLFVFLTAGWYGPFQGVLAWAFLHWDAASAFRELYDFAPLAWTLSCAVAGRGVMCVGRTAAFGAVAAAMCATGALWWPSHFAGQLLNWTAPPSLQAMIGLLAHTRGTWRVLFVPARWPVAPRGWTRGGVDPVAYGVAEHPAANSYILSSTQALTLAFLERRDPQAGQWLRALGIGATLVEPGIASKIAELTEPPHVPPPGLNSRPSVQRGLTAGLAIWGTPMAIAVSDVQVVRSPLDWHAGPAYLMARDALPPSLTDPDLAPAADVLIPRGDLTNVDPSRGWVDVRLWNWVDPRIAALERGVVTWSQAPFPVPSPRPNLRTMARILLLSGRLFVDRRPFALPKGRIVWVALPATAKSLTVHNGVCALGEFAWTRGKHLESLPRYRPPRVTALHFDPRALRVQGRVPPGTRWIILKEGFAPGWVLRLGQGEVIRHLTAVSYANAWEVRVPASTRVDIVYRPARWVRLAQYLGAALWLLYLAVWLVSSAAAFTRTRRRCGTGASRELPHLPPEGKP